MGKYIVLSFCCAVFLLSCHKQREAALPSVEEVVIAEDTVLYPAIEDSVFILEGERGYVIGDEPEALNDGNMSVSVSEDTIAFLPVPTMIEEGFLGHFDDYYNTMPEFPGGVTALMEFIKSNIKYPLSAKKNGVEGRVSVSFIVEKDGSITDIEIVRGVDPALDAETIRIIESMPKWQPGSERGKPVAAKFTLPITFRIQ